MYYSYVFGVVGLLVGLSPLFAVPARAADTPQVVISEINWGGSARSTADEWFELANTTGAPVDVGGWVVSGVATSGGAIALAAGTTVAPYGTLLVANYAMGEQSTLRIAPHLVTTAVSIPNRTLEVILAMPDGTVVDSVSDSGDLSFGQSTAPFASMERDPATLGWLSASASVNLSDGQLGTPGVFAAVIAADATPPSSPTEETVVEEATVTESIEETPEDAIESPDADTAVVAEDADEEAVTPEAVVEETVVPEVVVEEVIVEVAAEAPVEEIPQEDIAEATEATFTIDEVAPTVEEVIAEATVDPLIESVPTETPDTSAETTATEPVTAPAQPEEEPVAPRAAAPVDATTGNIVINELLSRPAEGEDEWIELFNADTVTIDVSGWQLRDASGKTTDWPDTTIAPGAFALVLNPKGKLNNDGDSVTLIDATGAVVDNVDYGTATLPSPKPGESAARFADGWAVTLTPTAGAENVLTQATIASVPAEAVAVTSTTSYAPDSDNPVAAEHYAPASDEPVFDESADDVTTVDQKTVTIVATAAPVTTTAAKSSSTKSRKTSAKSTTVQVTGTVIAAPGTFGTQMAFIDGAALYLHAGDWPTLQVGDVVHAEGTWSEARGERRLKLASADAVRVLRHETATPTPITHVAALVANTLVTVEGDVIARDGEKLTLLVDGAELTVVANTHTDVTWGGITASRIAITGVVRATANGLVLMPRSQNDIVPVTETALDVATVVAAASGGSAEPFIGGGLLAGALGALAYWFRRSRNLIPQA